MRTTDKQIINLPVYTEHFKTFLGYVIGFEMDSETHFIIKYFVAKNKLVNELLGGFLDLEHNEIASAQVVVILADKMIVDDVCSTELERASLLAVNKAKESIVA